MGIIISDTINNFSDNLIASPTINAILSNPIYTAIVIAFICLLIIMYVYSDEDIEDSTALSIRTSFYVFITTMLLLFLYDKKVTKDMREQYADGDMDRVMKVISGSGSSCGSDYDKHSSTGKLTEQLFNDEIVPVTIRTNFDPESPSLSESTNAHNEIIS